MEDTKKEVKVSIFPGSANEDNSREKIIDSVGKKLKKKRKRRLVGEYNHRS